MPVNRANSKCSRTAPWDKLVLARRDANARELLDAEVIDEERLRRNLRDIRTINGILGWRAFAVREVARQVSARRLTSFTLLDVASGSGDIPRAVARWAARAGISAHILATDISPRIVATARAELSAEQTAHAETADALALTYPPGGFDIALCTLALHHFAPEPATRLLANLARVGQTVMVFDAARSPVAYGGAWLLTRILRMDHMTRHDAPMSVRRAYSLAELRDLAMAAGLRDARVRMGFPYRLALIASGDADQPG